MLRILCSAVVASFFLSSVTGCQTVETAPDTAPAPAAKSAPAPAAKPAPAPVARPAPAPKAAPQPVLKAPSFHAWTYLRSHGEEPGGYATYSYVLAGRDRSDVSHARRYQALIAAIIGSTPSTGDMPRSVPRELMNLFLIPSARDSDAWNLGLSKSLVSALTASDIRFNNPGPFIVTLYQPISFRGSPEVTMLFVDLTNTHPEAMSEIATAYKMRISEAPLDGVERLNSLRLTLLNGLLIANDSIGFARAAYADLVSAFGSK